MIGWWSVISGMHTNFECLSKIIESAAAVPIRSILPFDACKSVNDVIVESKLHFSGPRGVRLTFTVTCMCWNLCPILPIARRLLSFVDQE